MKFFAAWRLPWRGEVEHRLNILEFGSNRIMTDIAELRASFKAYTEKVEAYINAMEAFRANVPLMISEAIARDDMGEAVDLEDLREEIDVAASEIPLPPLPFDPSGN